MMATLTPSIRISLSNVFLLVVIVGLIIVWQRERESRQYADVTAQRQILKLYRGNRWRGTKVMLTAKQQADPVLVKIATALREQDPDPFNRQEYFQDDLGKRGHVYIGYAIRIKSMTNQGKSRLVILQVTGQRVPTLRPWSVEGSKTATIESWSWHPRQNGRIGPRMMCNSVTKTTVPPARAQSREGMYDVEVELPSVEQKNIMRRGL